MADPTRLTTDEIVSTLRSVIPVEDARDEVIRHTTGGQRALIEAHAMPLEQLDALIEHLLADGTRDGALLAGGLNERFGRSARRMASRAYQGEMAP